VVNVLKIWFALNAMELSMLMKITGALHVLMVVQIVQKEVLTKFVILVKKDSS
jgi:hypothetical protein